MDNFRNNFRRKFKYYMQDRYGVDDLARLTLSAAGIFAVISSFTRQTTALIFRRLALLFIALTIFRVFSRDSFSRLKENIKYLGIRQDFQTKGEIARIRYDQRNTHRFFTCPGCKTTLRIPKGKGKVKITCPKCGKVFSGKS
ncbi:MAG: hypothetical protein GX061_04560 [Eubacteriaceae bacterium]|nr:hypothetical protein [Eubacteriaceae bacterium]